MELEQEFRQGLRLEAHRYKQARGDLKALQSELDSTSSALVESQKESREARGMLAELNNVVREQQSKLLQLRNQHSELSTKHQTLEQQLSQASANESDLTKQVQEQKAHAEDLTHKLAASENVITGLREERKLWSRELAAQGATLAADRGKLEAQVAQFMAEAESARQAEQSLQDTVRIKTKMIDDQADSLRKAKQHLTEKERQLTAFASEAARKEADLQDR